MVSIRSEASLRSVVPIGYYSLGWSLYYLGSISNMSIQIVRLEQVPLKGSIDIDLMRMVLTVEWPGVSIYITCYSIIVAITCQRSRSLGVIYPHRLMLLHKVLASHRINESTKEKLKL